MMDEIEESWSQVQFGGYTYAKDPYNNWRHGYAGQYGSSVGAPTAALLFEIERLQKIEDQPTLADPNSDILGSITIRTILAHALFLSESEMTDVSFASEAAQEIWRLRHSLDDVTENLKHLADDIDVKATRIHRLEDQLTAAGERHSEMAKESANWVNVWDQRARLAPR